MQAIQAVPHASNAARYAKCIAVSKRDIWDIERDVIRGRSFDFTRKFLPDGLSMIDRLRFLGDDEKRLVSQIQGRSYANMLGLVERFIGASVLKLSREHWLGDQDALAALTRYTDEALKRQALFRRIDSMIASGMPAGYRFAPRPGDVAAAVLGASTWAVLGLSCLVELFTRAHCRWSIEPDAGLSELWRDVFLFHWKDQAQHAELDEIEWQREDSKLDAAARERAVDDLIALVAAMDGMLQAQAQADAGYFLKVCGRALHPMQMEAIGAAFLAAYRWQYIVSGAEDARFKRVLATMITPAQRARIAAALVPLVRSAVGPLAAA